MSFPLEYLGCDKIWCAANSSEVEKKMLIAYSMTNYDDFTFEMCYLLFSTPFCSCSQTKVPDFDLHRVCQQNISQFQVPMYDALAMQMSKAGDNLPHDVAHFLFAQVLFSA